MTTEQYRLLYLIARVQRAVAVAEDTRPEDQKHAEEMYRPVES